MPEDVEMQGFIPVKLFLKNINLKAEQAEDPVLINRIRAKRLTDFGVWVCGIDANNKKLVIMTWVLPNCFFCTNFTVFSYSTENDGQNKFEPACIQPDPTESLLEEMRSVSLVETNNSTSKGKTAFIQKKNIHTNYHYFIEKRGGILKPQGSLEKNREEREQVLTCANEISDSGSPNSSTSKDSSKLKRVRQNVALQSIFKKIEESKQVFK